MTALPLVQECRWARDVLDGHPRWFATDDGTNWYVYDRDQPGHPLVGVGADLCTALRNALAHEGNPA